MTTDVLPGYDIRDVLGEVIGVTARTHNPFAEGITSPARRHQSPDGGGPDPLARGGRRADGAERAPPGRHAVVGMRFDHREVTSSWVEICAYGTAVVVAFRGASAFAGNGRHADATD